ncbi:hypothetical protein F5141DRAFT_1095866 [Pisolithus sp. B1]|nr:hypothetical protein F5141DRAFT_1095866 [Pisolithus sp. B1]
MVIGPAEVGYTAIPNVGPKNKGRAHEHTHEHANCTPKLCLYLGPGGKRCLQPITYATVPAHFESHGIKDIYRGASVTCQWEGCFEKCSRHNFVRHIREKHLGHTRRSTACNSEEGLRQHTSFREEPGDAGSQNESRTSEHANLAPQICQYGIGDGRSCSRLITYASVSTHFAACHNVRALSRQVVVVCQWNGCGQSVRRHSFIRHIRERHLGLPRGSALRNSAKAG